ncbi:MAG: hypothetical protein QGH66_06835 [Dehalococcoidia bacterium]|jgi:hypothetical protein|nr:hypothetical protein [Dehalococcoidia bacterium]
MDKDREKAEGTHSQVREGDFRIWDISPEAALCGVKDFLEYAGYELQPEDYIGFLRPDFRARRQDKGKEFQVVGVLANGIEDAVLGCIRLMAMKAVLGDAADYALAMPMVNEYLMIEYFMEDRGRWYFAMKDHEIMMWLLKPDEEITWCILGSPRDRHFNNFFVLPDFSVEQYINAKLLPGILEEEEY